MKVRKIPMRTCVVTKEQLPKRELLRIVRTPDGDILVDDTGKVNGRGAYLKLDKDVFEKAKRTDKEEQCRQYVQRFRNVYGSRMQCGTYPVM